MIGLLIGISNAITGKDRGIGTAIANEYSIRVIADGGVVESLPCVVNAINNLEAL